MLRFSFILSINYYRELDLIFGCSLKLIIVILVALAASEILRVLSSRMVLRGEGQGWLECAVRPHDLLLIQTWRSP